MAGSARADHLMGLEYFYAAAAAATKRVASNQPTNTSMKFKEKKKKTKEKSLIRLNVPMSIHKQTDLMKIARREREWIKENHCIHVRALIDKNFYGVALFVVAVADANSMSNGICIIIGKRRRSLWSVVSRKQTPWYRFFERSFLKFTSFACKARV